MVGTTASYFPKMTNLLNEICKDIAEKIIKEGQPIVLVDEFDWYREVLSLFAKQVNLCESCILLLENGMEQEAYLLARSQFNNMLWIKYICEGEGNSRVKEYFCQPYISQIFTNKKFKKMITEYSDELDERFLEAKVMEQLDKVIDENTKMLKQENIPIKVKSIAELARQDRDLLSMYLTFYNEGSKFEHSDISKTKLYRKQATEEYDSERAFIFNLGRSDKECWISVFKCSFMSIFYAFEIYYAGKEIALHSLCENAKGEHVTDKNHYPSTKNVSQEELLSSYRMKMAEVGSGAAAFLEAFKDTEMYQCHHYRSISGILALRKKYGDDTVDKACARACHYGNITYRAVMLIFQYGCWVPAGPAHMGRCPAGCFGHCVGNCLWQSKTTAFLTKTAVSLDGKRLLYIFLTVPSIAWMPLRGKSRTVPMLCQNHDISSLGCLD